jgi:uncharacterized membrane protein YhaH (DUF805 family)
VNVRKWLFGFQGRINRSEFWMLTFVAACSFLATGIFSFLPAGVIRTLLAVATILAGLVVYLAAATKRLHDRDKLAWFLLLFFGVPSLIQTATSEEKGMMTFSLFGGGLSSFAQLISLAISVWMIVELGCLRGTSGTNRYGSDPLDTTVNEPLRD